MHCDESDDPLSRHVETLVHETLRLGMSGRVTGSHLTSMHSMDNYYVSKLMVLMQQANLHVVANPLINITIQGRHDSYPKRRGMTRVKELLAHGINVAFGHDCVMDPWYSMGSHDMLEVASMGLHVAQMTGVNEIKQAFSAITDNAAAVMNLPGYGIEKGCYADFVVLQARHPAEAIRLRSTSLYVVRRGKVIAHSPPVKSDLVLDAERHSIDWMQ
jgi:cytosine deaminase